VDLLRSGARRHLAGSAPALENPRQPTAEVAVLLDIEDMDAAHLYVAMTRGSKKLVVCSRSPVLNG